MSTYRKVILLFDCFCVLFYVAAIVHLTTKAGFPENSIFAGQIDVNGIRIAGNDDIEFAASSYQIGDEVAITLPGGRVEPVRLEPYYDLSMIIFDALVVTAIFCIGLFVYLYKPGDRGAVMFHLAAGATGMAVIATKTIYHFPFWNMGPALCILFFLAYTTVSVFFLHFTFVFPSVRWNSYLPLIRWLYGFGFLLAGISVSMYLIAANGRSLEHFHSYMTFSILQNVFAFLVFVAGIINMVYSYRATVSVGERKKIRWVLFGCTVGPAPFVFGWVLPSALGLGPWISEWMFKLFLLLVPVSLAIAIVRYRVLDIDLLINRGMVYGVVIGVGALLYVAVVALSTRVIEPLTRDQSLLIGGITAGILGLCFDPVRRKVQHFVDRSFFRMQYDFRLAQRSFVAEVGQCVDARQAVRLLVEGVDGIIGPERIGFFSLSRPGNRLRLVNHRGFERLESHGVHFAEEQLKSSLKRPVGVDDRIEPGVDYESADADVFRKWEISLVFPLHSEGGSIMGFLVLGPKKSGFRYTEEDMDLLGSMTTQAGMAMERIALQEKLLLETAEAQRLEELSRLKSYFVSSVSHDLKTPLTSIRMFAELLRTSPAIHTARATEYLEIIEGESGRLTRLINSVLDFAKIERGVKEYNFRPVDINECLERVMAALEYQFRMEKFDVQCSYIEGLPEIQADPDAVMEACINLLTNAMKYSHDKKEISVTTGMADQTVTICVSDCGIGIPQDELEHIFEPFYRSRAGKEHGAGGAGLGLALVRHTMEAHGGRVDVKSIQGKGSTFTLIFPSKIGAGT